jgi:hypothetical protein
MVWGFKLHPRNHGFGVAICTLPETMVQSFWTEFRVTETVRSSVAAAGGHRGGRLGPGCRGGSERGQLQRPRIGIIIPLHCDTQTPVAACVTERHQNSCRCVQECRSPLPTAPFWRCALRNFDSRLEGARASTGGHASHGQNLC